MRYLRFHHKDFVGYGRLEGDLIRAIEGDLFGTYKVTETTVPFTAARLLAPCLPTKIVAIGVNYKDHAAEFKKELPSEPLIFLKPPSALLAPEEAIVYPEGVTKRVDYEGELAVVIKKRARYVTPEGNIILDLDINKDSRGETTAAGIAINTKHIKTQVLVENGEFHGKPGQ